MATNTPTAAQLCLKCLLTLLAVAIAVAASFAWLSLDLGQLISRDAAAGMLRFLLTFFPPELSPAFLARTGVSMLETLAISAVGTLCAAVLGFGLALPASGLYGDALRTLSRLLLNLLRSIPELVWAGLTVLAVGLGPFAGTLALALHTAGVLGRLFAEALENAPRTPARALAEKGAPAALVFMYGTLPCVWPQFLSYTLYRWETNIRAAAILGFVGAGGLGQMLYFELSLFHMPQACTVIIAMLVLAAVVDTASAIMRVDRPS
ncbi:MULTISPECIES: phosphonate ABC transporter, permease protein PhnE [Cupriavidus]|uniref:Phosphonate ABC transporter, permease protein PhnE n=1 Tax=Cupriavidus oxalaticus TaxID=96344 RepID=A0A4P7L4E6_9BURK|nr:MULTISPECIES: phosphonate ABC transporter, permease protein PhnE [Cupriavidus]MBF6986576.1 phosphonate ABC transporter, permease protein PhnE [Cupriavidus sp. IK-TO18]QBY49905.1 phosphonate ABC transporter, permease protein PhnE [Cupriavidus oxalaticus]